MRASGEAAEDLNPGLDFQVRRPHFLDFDLNLSLLLEIGLSLHIF